MALPIDNSQQQFLNDLFKDLEGDLRAYVRSKIRRMRGVEIQVEDVVQESFLRISSIDDPVALENPRTFLFRIASNLIIDLARKKTEKPLSSIKLVDDLDQNKLDFINSVKLTPERVVSGQEDLKLILKAVDKLPSSCQRVFVLQRSYGYTYAEVASILNISESMVQKHMSKALYLLHKVLP